MSIETSNILCEVALRIHSLKAFTEIRLTLTGTSKSVVTTGLIGGRVGNKGGVGVSVNIDGTTLLFINAHLAGAAYSAVFGILLRFFLP